MCPGTSNPVTTLCALDIDPPAEVERIVGFLRRSVYDVLRKRGAVIHVQGDVNSAVALALAERAFGPSGVAALILSQRCGPSQASSMLIASLLGTETVCEDITAAVDGFGCDRRRDEAIRHVIPAYQPQAGCTAEIILPPDPLDAESLHLLYLSVQVPSGRKIVAPLPPRQFLIMIAAANTRRRICTNYLYYHAETRNFAALSPLDCGTYRSGFFAKFGENGADVLPLAHLYAGQVRSLAEYLGVPREILDAQPQTQAMDRMLLALDEGIAPELAAEAAGVPIEELLHTYRDILHKRQATEYSRTGPLMLDQAQRSGLSSSSSPV